MQTASENIIFAGGFKSGLGIYRAGKRVGIVPECTWWDDDHIRVIERDGEAVLQSERREYSGTRSAGTDEWSDIRSLGPIAGLSRSGYDEDGEHDVHICSDVPLVWNTLPKGTGDARYCVNYHGPASEQSGAGLCASGFCEQCESATVGRVSVAEWDKDTGDMVERLNGTEWLNEYCVLEPARWRMR